MASSDEPVAAAGRAHCSRVLAVAETPVSHANPGAMSTAAWPSRQVGSLSWATASCHRGFIYTSPSFHPQFNSIHPHPAFCFCGSWLFVHELTVILLVAVSGGAHSPPSDNDGGERPVRKQLKETSIDSTPAGDQTMNGRKRSFEESRDDHGDPNENGDHSRKRSRECTPEEAKKTESVKDKDGISGSLSQNVPKKKRSREQLEDESSKKSEALGEAAQEPIQTEPSDETSAAKGEPEKKRHRDNSQEPDTKTDNGFATSAFGKAAAASPFAAFAKPAASTEESTQKTTQPSAFASSSLSAFAGSETSPFSALGSSTSSVFKPAGAGSSGFASASGTSGFGALGSGFAGVGGGFGAAGKAGGLSSFASSNAPATLGESKPKAIGAEESDEEGSDNDEEETSTFEAEKTDERFYEQTIETGEEQESTIFTCKAKLFHFSNKEWKERGIGTFKVNVRENASGKTTGRMIMRADGALRVMLNSPIFKGMNYGDAHNNAPESKQILLASMEDGKTVPLLLRTGNEAYAKELYEVIGDLLEKA
ncbi:uncharacterized protein N7498_001596 [Penicillium cinerascens]|uniref:RanBD1 domain-containing protein n=1 Tax=Penicillium cinerascens TaxID=70096 RepID=A0A9W9N8F1_9EURO|nr:uncharacterized protein N7498_001596 [Penicillium cinerascens]KAJ5215189.1 hypothetical protein N7498_001596 [Penicillium cinerascens]